MLHNKKSLSYRLLALVAVLGALGLLAAAAAAQDEGTAPGRPFMGIGFEDAEGAVLVTLVMPASPAAAAGIEVGDTVTAVNGAAVTAENIAETLANHAPGDTITVDLLRDGEPLTVEITLGRRASGPETIIVPGGPGGRGMGPGGRGPGMMPQAGMGIFQRAALGITVERDAAAEGLRVTSVTEGSAAAEAGIVEGDIITHVDGEAVSTLRSIRAVLAALQAGDVVEVELLRDGEPLTLSVTLQPAARLFELPSSVTASAIGISFADGRLSIESLSEEHPLYAAGLREGDAITAVNGNALEPGALAGALRDIISSETLTLSVERDGETLEIDIPTQQALSLLMGLGMGGRGFQFEGMPSLEDIMPMLPGGRFDFGSGRGGVWLGVRYFMLDEAAAQQFETGVAAGAYIVEVEAGSPAERAGLLAGDVVTAVGGESLNGLTLAAALRPYSSGDVLQFELLRDGETLSIEVTLAPAVQSARMLPGRSLVLPGLRNLMPRLFNPEALPRFTPQRPALQPEASL